MKRNRNRIDISSLDERINTPKNLVKLGEWKPRSDSQAWECIGAFTFNGQICQDNIVFQALPAYGMSKAKCFYNIAGTSEQAARLDMGRSNGKTYGLPSHVNKGADKPSNLPYRVRSPHAHLWQDNREGFNERNTRNKLKFAIEVPADNLTWEDAVKWFCDKCFISLQDDFKVGFPPKDNLL